MLESKRQRVARLVQDMRAASSDESSAAIDALEKDHHLVDNHSQHETERTYWKPGPKGEADLVNRLKAMQKREDGDTITYAGKSGDGVHTLERCSL